MAGASPVMALYAELTGCRGGISDNSLNGLVVKSLTRQGNVVFHYAAFLDNAFLGKAGFINIVIVGMAIKYIKSAGMVNSHI